MKIILDKIISSPPHALNRREVKFLLDTIPTEWNIKLSVIHLKATLPENSRFERPAIYSYLDNGRLNVCSRGLSRDKACQEILRELAIQQFHITMRMIHRLSDTELKRLDKIIAPLVQQAKAKFHQTEVGVNQ